MVSMSKPQKFAQAKDYLTKENYYQKNSELGYYHGQGLEYLGLEQNAEVTKESYERLLQGYHPETGEALVKNAGNEDRRVGFDVTFSAPKSVSVLMEYHEAKSEDLAAQNLKEAHNLAMQKAMKSLEERFSKTRITVDGKQIKVDAKLTYATFEHNTSREVLGEIDPQLHSHNFIFSTVFYKDEKSGKIKNLALSNEEIYKNKMYLGQVYRSEFAKNLAEQGYKIEVTNRSLGFFEVEGFSEKQLKTFSSRTQNINDLMPIYKEKYPKMKEHELLSLIVKDTKKAKKEIDRDEVRGRNLSRMESVGIDKNLISSLKKEPKSIEINEKNINEHIDKTLNNILEKQSVFTREEFIKESLKYGLGLGYTEKNYLDIMAKRRDIIQLLNH